ncbi:MAG: FadR/GntR family transcriptional regulator [Sciscionella sp.]
MVESGIQPVRRLKVADAVAAQLEELILQKHYAVGDRLPAERMLAEEFGVGRTSMREALRMVEATGLVRTQHGVGAFVVSTTRRNDGLASMLVFDHVTVRDLFEVRTTLERETASLAARRRSETAVEDLRELIGEMADDHLTDETFVELDGRFHLAVADATNNPLYAQLMGTLRPLFLTYSRRVIGLPGRRETAHAGHTEILEAIVAKRGRDAGAAAIRHIRQVEADIVAHLERDGTA